MEKFEQKSQKVWLIWKAKDDMEEKMPLIPSIHGSMCQMVPRKTEEESKEELKEELIKFYEKLESEQIDIPTEYAEIIERHLLDLI